MKWLKNLIEKLFRKNNIKLLEEPKNMQKSDFIITLKQQADLEINDGNGYKIAQKLRLKDMI